MKINLNALSRYKDKVISEDIIFPKEMLEDINSLLDVKSCNASVRVCDYGDIIRVEVDLKAKVVLQCAYTLEPIDYDVDTDEYIDFSMLDEDEEDDNIFYVDRPEVDLTPYIFGILITEIPTKVIKEGATLPLSGQGYEVLTEDEYEEKMKNRVDSRFSALDDLDFDE